jgi:hypothetical protein
MYIETHSLSFCEPKNWSSKGLTDVVSSPSILMLNLHNGYSTKGVPALRQKIKKADCMSKVPSYVDSRSASRFDETR